MKKYLISFSDEEIMRIKRIDFDSDKKEALIFLFTLIRFWDAFPIGIKRL